MNRLVKGIAGLTLLAGVGSWVYYGVQAEPTLPASARQDYTKLNQLEARARGAENLGYSESEVMAFQDEIDKIRENPQVKSFEDAMNAYNNSTFFNLGAPLALIGTIVGSRLLIGSLRPNKRFA